MLQNTSAYYNTAFSVFSNSIDMRNRNDIFLSDQSAGIYFLSLSLSPSFFFVYLPPLIKSFVEAIVLKKAVAVILSPENEVCKTNVVLLEMSSIP